MIAIGNLIIAKIPLLLNYRSTLKEIIDSYFAADLFNANSLDEVEVIADHSALIGFANVMRLIKWIFKSYPELLPDDISPWIEIPQVFMPVNFTELQTVAIAAALQGAIFTRSTDNFCSQLALLVDISEEGIVIGRCFKAMAILIEHEVPLQPDFVQQFIAAGWRAMDGRLRCQEIEELPARSSQQIYNFLRLLFEKDPSFPFDKLIQHGRKLLDRQERLFEVTQYTALLQHCYETGVALPSLSKKALIGNITKAFRKFIAVFDSEEGNPFCVAPTPLAALRALLDREPAVVQPLLPTVLSFLQGVLNAVHQGETHYWSTVTYSLAFLASLMKVNPDDFAYEQWIPLIAAKLFLRSEENCAESIYKTILRVIANQGTFGAEVALLGSFAQTLGLKERKFEKLNLSSETIQRMIQLVGQLIGLVGDNVSLPTLFQDEQSYERFIARTGLGA
jgi:hypothetical protein